MRHADRGQPALILSVCHLVAAPPRYALRGSVIQWGLVQLPGYGFNPDIA